MRITRFLHTAILVSNLEKAEKFYSNVLGLSKINRTLKYPGAWYEIGEFQIHLIVQPDFKSNPQNSEKWGRNPHVAFAVVDLEEAKKRLSAGGYPVQLSASGRPALFTLDPDGNIIEIGEIAPP